MTHKEGIMKKQILLALYTLIITAFIITHAHAYRIVTLDLETAPTVVPAHGHAKVEAKTYNLKEDGWLIEVTPMIINGPGYLLHHGGAILIPDKTTFCGQTSPASIFWLAGREHETLSLYNGFNLPGNAYGIRVKKGQKVMFTEGIVMLYNPDNQDYKDVKFRLTAKFYIPEVGDPDLKNLEMLPLFFTKRPQVYAGQFCPQYKEEVEAYKKDYAKLYPKDLEEGAMESTEINSTKDMKNTDMGSMTMEEHMKMMKENKGGDDMAGMKHDHSKMGGHAAVTYWIPAKSSKVDKWVVPLEIGTEMEVYAVLSHVHDYADYIKLYKNGEEVFNGPLTKDDKGHVVSLPVVLRPGFTLKEGDKLEMETKYTNPFDFPIDAMGIMGLYVHKIGKGDLVKFPEKLNLPKLEAKNN